VRRVYLHDGWSVTMHCLRGEPAAGSGSGSEPSEH
jgi:hypothetical protein